VSSNGDGAPAITQKRGGGGEDAEACTGSEEEVVCEGSETRWQHGSMARRQHGWTGVCAADRLDRLNRLRRDRFYPKLFN